MGGAADLGQSEGILTNVGRLHCCFNTSWILCMFRSNNAKNEIKLRGNPMGYYWVMGPTRKGVKSGGWKIVFEYGDGQHVIYGGHVNIGPRLIGLPNIRPLGDNMQICFVFMIY